MGNCCGSREGSDKENGQKPLGEESIAITLSCGDNKKTMNAQPDTKVLQMMKDIEILHGYKDFDLQLGVTLIDPALTLREAGIKEGSVVEIITKPESSN